jgi:hypothetical protein
VKEYYKKGFKGNRVRDTNLPLYSVLAGIFASCLVEIAITTLLLA